jgi:hypothetical protein
MEILVDEGGAAAIIGCSVGLMRKWRRFGKGPRYCKLGRLVRYKQADIDSFLEAHRVETAGGR